MPNTHHQMVFPFLAEDPLYLREIREERIAADVKTALEPVLRQRMVEILDNMARAGFKEKLDTLVADAVKSSTSEMQAMFSDIRSLLIDLAVRCRDCHDPADWWKNGMDPEQDQDNPL